MTVVTLKRRRDALTTIREVFEDAGIEFIFPTERTGEDVQKRNRQSNADAASAGAGATPCRRFGSCDRETFGTAVVPRK